VSTVASLAIDLAWEGELVFGAKAGDLAFKLDSRLVAGPSPVQALAAGLAGCMAMDVVHILTKGRHPLKGLRVHLDGERAQENPKRLVKAALLFVVEGQVPADAVERAIALSRDTYCSVWHSLRPDIEFTTSFEIVAA
jgi:putative redox protein